MAPESETVPAAWTLVDSSDCQKGWRPHTAGRTGRLKGRWNSAWQAASGAEVKVQEHGTTLRCNGAGDASPGSSVAMTSSTRLQPSVWNAGGQARNQTPRRPKPSACLTRSIHPNRGVAPGSGCIQGMPRLHRGSEVCTKLIRHLTIQDTLPCIPAPRQSMQVTSVFESLAERATTNVS